MKKIKLKENEGLVLRTCNESMRGYGGFQWPESGYIEAPDWDPTPRCGGGLHGLWFGEGDTRHLSTNKNAKWLLVRVNRENVVEISGKIKFSRGEVVFCGKKNKAIRVLMASARGRAIPLASKSKCHGDVFLGAFSAARTDEGNATAENDSAARTDVGNATAENDSAARTDVGNATAGDDSAARTNVGNATAGNDSAARTNVGNATAGAFSAARTDVGNATAGIFSAARTSKGNATAGGSLGCMGKRRVWIEWGLFRFLRVQVCCSQGRPAWCSDLVRRRGRESCCRRN